MNVALGFIPERLLSWPILPHWFCLPASSKNSALLAGPIPEGSFLVFGDMHYFFQTEMGHSGLVKICLLPDSPVGSSVNSTLWQLVSPKTLLMATLHAFAQAVSPAWGTLFYLPSDELFSFKIQLKCHLCANSPRGWAHSSSEPQSPWKLLKCRQKYRCRSWGRVCLTDGGADWKRNCLPTPLYCHISTLPFSSVFTWLAGQEVSLVVGKATAPALLTSPLQLGSCIPCIRRPAVSPLPGHAGGTKL